jgi:hypothetical protein
MGSVFFCLLTGISVYSWNTKGPFFVGLTALTVYFCFSVSVISCLLFMGIIWGDVYVLRMAGGSFWLTGGETLKKYSSFSGSGATGSFFRGGVEATGFWSSCILIKLDYFLALLAF